MRKKVSLGPKSPLIRTALQVPSVPIFLLCFSGPFFAYVRVFVVDHLPQAQRSTDQSALHKAVNQRRNTAPSPRPLFAFRTCMRRPGCYPGAWSS